MSLLALRDVHKSLGPRTLFEGVNLALVEGQRVGLVGANGSGKSTLARILAGIDLPDRGTRLLARGTTVAYLAQEPTLPVGATARDAAREGLADWDRVRRRYEEVGQELELGRGDVKALAHEQGELLMELERLGGWSQDAAVDALLSKLGVDYGHRCVDELSGGERRRVALARLLLSRPDVAILDEPTNHLDPETTEWLETYLRDEFTGALLLITHDRYFLDRIAEQTWELDRGQVTVYAGGWELYLDGRAEREVLQARTEANRQNFLRQEIEWLRRQPKARTTKSKSRIDRIESAIEQGGPPRERSIDMTLRADRAGGVLLDLKDLCIAVGDRTLVNGLSLTVMPGDRIGILGRNGSGKSTLLRTVTGELAPASGLVDVRKNTRLLYFDQQRAALREEGTIWENVAEEMTEIPFGDATIHPASYLERFLFFGEQQRQPVSSLSGGERARVVLAKLLRGRSNLLVMDEPTNDLDTTTLAALEDLLCSYPGAVLIVSHDRYLLDRVSTHTLHLDGKGNVDLRPGGFSDGARLRLAAAQVAAQAAKPAVSTPSTPPSRGGTPASGSAKLRYAEVKELEGLPARIEALEERVAELEAKIADSTIFATAPQEAQRIVQELASSRAECSTLLDRWAELEERARP